jgi:hypothetical protein
LLDLKMLSSADEMVPDGSLDLQMLASADGMVPRQTRERRLDGSPSALDLKIPAIRCNQGLALSSKFPVAGTSR